MRPEDPAIDAPPEDGPTLDTEGPAVDVTALDVPSFDAATLLDDVPVSAADASTGTVTVDGARRPPRGGTTQRDTFRFPAGTVLGQRYRLDDLLGEGGGGLVHRGVDLESGERVAIKVLHPDRVADEASRARFRREFKAVSRLDHRHCLRVRAEGQAGPYLYMVMDYVPGGDLSRLTGAPLERLLPVLIDLADALECVHRRGIVHRDLKPSNVLLTADEPPEPRLADFGIVAVRGDIAADASLQDSLQSSLAGEGGAGLRGTVDYMAPEQVRGEPVDPRADLYAFGGLIFRLVAGRAPFEGTAYSRLVSRLLQPAPALADVCPVDPRLARIVARLLERDPADRHQSAAALRAELCALRDALAVGRAGAAPQPSR